MASAQRNQEGEEKRLDALWCGKKDVLFEERSSPPSWVEDPVKRDAKRCPQGNEKLSLLFDQTQAQAGLSSKRSRGLAEAQSRPLPFKCNAMGRGWKDCSET